VNKENKNSLKFL